MCNVSPSEYLYELSPHLHKLTFSSLFVQKEEEPERKYHTSCIQSIVLKCFWVYEVWEISNIGLIFLAIVIFQHPDFIPLSLH